jgi:hypothetical protein
MSLGKMLPLAAVALLLGCQDQLTAPAEVDQPLFGASVVVDREVTPFTWIIPISCGSDGDGEFVIIEGVRTRFTRITVTPAGVRTGRVSFLYSGLAGYGVETGDIYHASRTTLESEHDLTATLPYSEVRLNMWRVVSASVNASFLLRTIVQFNADDVKVVDQTVTTPNCFSH